MSQLPDEEWFDTEMALGSSKRFAHTCSKGDRPVIVTRMDYGWGWYCHRCKIGGRKEIAGCSPEKTMRWIKSLSLPPTRIFKEVTLPSDYTVDLSPGALAYCYIRGLNKYDIEKYKIGYSPFYNRLIFPLYKNKELIFWEGRNLGEVTRKNPKYIKRVSQSWQDVLYEVTPIGEYNAIVLTEDIISTIRVGKVLPSIAMVSTHVRDKLIFDLILKSSWEKIFIWLDPDKRDKAINMAFKYQAYGLSVLPIYTEQDPKWYDEEEIRSVLECFG